MYAAAMMHDIDFLLVQRLYLRNVPALDDIGGPAEGCTCIVTGPTRHVQQGCPGPANHHLNKHMSSSD